GRPYTAIGAVLIQRGELKREAVSMQSIRAWLLAHPAEAPQLMNANASYVFFTEQPIGDPALGALGAQGVPLTPEASLAVDLTVHALGIPAWLETTAPDPDPTKPNHAFLSQRLDLLPRHPEHLAVHVVVVLAVARRAAIDSSTDVGRALAQLHGHLGERPAADLRARHFSEPRERGQLRVIVATVP